MSTAAIWADSYLEIDHFDDIDEAAAFYHELQSEIHNQQLLPFHLVDFAAEKAHERAVTTRPTCPDLAGIQSGGIRRLRADAFTGQARRARHTTR